MQWIAMTHSFQPQSLKDVKDSDMLTFGAETMTVGRFKQAVQACLGGPMARGLSAELANQGVVIDRELLAPNQCLEDYARWFHQGIECEVLPARSQGWQSARVRIQVAVEVAVVNEAATEGDTTCCMDTEYIEDLAQILRVIVNR